ncbi:MAG: N-acetylglucosamine-6-phosphate deacetylase [Acidimicrobiia bacterium]
MSARSEPATLAIRGGLVVSPDGLKRADVLVSGPVITLVGDVRHQDATAAATVVDAGGLLVAPGLIDLQCNGGNGANLTTEPERLWELAAELPAGGVTSWLPTLVSPSAEAVSRARAVLAASPPGITSVAQPLGLHVEGPVLNPARRGAHPAECLRTVEEADSACWSRAEGVAMVTLAPELPGALALVRDLVARGVVVAAGHSEATAAETLAAVAVGLSVVTHLFNAMAPLHHREPRLAGTALVDDRLVATVIVDGIHLHPLTVVSASRTLGSRLCLVTDHSAAASRLEDGTLAGSELVLIEAVRNLLAYTGRPVTEVLAAASIVPARVLGLTGRKGVVAPGADADLVLLAPDLRVVATIVAGAVAYRGS